LDSGSVNRGGSRISETGKGFQGASVLPLPFPVLGAGVDFVENDADLKEDIVLLSVAITGNFEVGDEMCLCAGGLAAAILLEAGAKFAGGKVVWINDEELISVRLTDCLVLILQLVTFHGCPSILSPPIPPPP
jgi:hypothetical protein